MAAFKLSYSEYKQLKRDLSVMDKKSMSRWIESIYKNGYNDGYEACKKEPGQVIDLEMLKIAVLATEGIGQKKLDLIVKNIEKLCFPSE